MPGPTGASLSLRLARGGNRRIRSIVTGIRSVLSIVVFIACANTKTNSYVAPGVMRTYQKTMVYAQTDPSQQRKVEDRFVAGLQKAGIEAYSSARTLPAEHNPDLEDAKFTELGIDTVLIVQIDSMKVVEKELVPSSTTTTKKKDGTVVTTQNAAVKGQIPEGAFTATLRDARTQAELWVNSGRSEGFWMATPDTLRDSFIDNAVADLASSGVLTVRKRAQ